MGPIVMFFINIVSCGNMVVYILPMLLGRTYDIQTDSVGIDIFSDDVIKKDSKPFENPQVSTEYMLIETTRDKRNFLGVSGELALKVSAGLVNIRGAGEYLKDTSQLEKSVQILLRTTFISMTEEIHPNAKPLDFWRTMRKESVGTHVVKSITYGAEFYASVNFIAHKAADLEVIKANVSASFTKSGAFDANAQGKLDSLSQNISSQAKMEINYYATVPIKLVPTTLEGLKHLVNDFKGQVAGINDGRGVPICAELRPLSDYNEDYRFRKDGHLTNSLDAFEDKFQELRNAKAKLKSLIASMPDNVPEDYFRKLVDFSDRLTKTLTVFHEVIGNLDLRNSSNQLEPALEAFDRNSRVFGKYTAEISKLAKDMVLEEDGYQPRGIYTHWGKRACKNKTSEIVYIGYMTSFLHEGGAGTEYQCFPENSDFWAERHAVGISEQSSKLVAARYKFLSMFFEEGVEVEDKAASCTVCTTPTRPTVKMFPGTSHCPADWIEEYTGFLVSSKVSFWLRSEHVCLDRDPDHYPSKHGPNEQDPIVVPVKLGNNHDDPSVPCAVCSK